MFPDTGPPANLKGTFSGIYESMFILFLVMNGNFDSVQEILDTIPATQLACALFMILSNWAILAIFTAVVSENMITTVEDRRREQEEAENKDKTERSVVKLLPARTESRIISEVRVQCPSLKQVPSNCRFWPCSSGLSNHLLANLCAQSFPGLLLRSFIFLIVDRKRL